MLRFEKKDQIIAQNHSEIILNTSLVSVLEGKLREKGWELEDFV